MIKLPKINLPPKVIETKKKIKRVLRKTFTLKNIGTFFVILATIAMIATMFLPYLL